MSSSEPPSPALIITAIILILLSMLFSASEAAFLSINKLRLRFLREQKHKRAILASALLEKKDLLLNTILICNNLVNIALSAIATSIALQLFGAAGVGYATLVVTIVLLIFGEITPKTLATHSPEKIAFFSAPIIKLFTVLLRPLVIGVTTVAKFFARLFGIQLKKENITFTEDEIVNFIEVGEEEGVLEATETKMMHKVLKFPDLSAKEIMTPRTQMTCITLDTSLQSIIELSQKTNFSRFPVLGKDIDDIQGMVYLKDLLFFTLSYENFSIKTIMHPAIFVSETNKMTSVQTLLRNNNQSAAIVLDEYSGVAGMLTIEDIKQELFGPVYEEHYQTSTAQIEKIHNNEFVCDGSVHIDYINEICKLNLDSKNFETLSGYITEQLERIPAKNETLAIDNAKFIIEDATDRKILRIRILLKEKKSDTEYINL